MILANLFRELGLLFMNHLVLFFILIVILTIFQEDVSLIVFILLALSFKIPLWIVFLACYLGVMLADSILFLFGKWIFQKLENNKRFEAKYYRVSSFIDDVLFKNLFLNLALIKFISGTRVIGIIYLSKQNKKYPSFFIADIFANLIWLIFFGTVGIAIAKGLSLIKYLFHNLEVVIILGIILIIFYRIIKKKLDRRLQKRLILH